MFRAASAVTAALAVSETEKVGILGEFFRLQNNPKTQTVVTLSICEWVHVHRKKLTRIITKEEDVDVEVPRIIWHVIIIDFFLSAGLTGQEMGYYSINMYV